MSEGKIKQQIVSDLRAIDPDKVILFGSFARGRFKKDSDIDLLVVKNTRLSLADRFSQARLSLSLNFPFDIFVLTEQELKDKLKNSFFFREIIEQGEVLYEKKRT